MIDLVGALRGLLKNTAVIELETHSRYRVYPQDITSVAALLADAAANTWGNWGQVIPLTTVPFEYHIIGLVVEAVSAATTYHIQLGYNIVDAIPPANYQVGERRLRVTTHPIARATELLAIAGQDIPANSKLWGRVKTASANADTCEISVVLTRHIQIVNPIAQYGAFPW